MGATLHDRIVEARRVLVGAGLSEPDAAVDAEVLARHALAWDRATLVARWREPPPAGFERRFSPLIDRRAGREPVALITGRREFWGLEFLVTRDVLVPRPETELIVEAAIAERLSPVNGRIADIGTGSGCLAVALALEFPTSSLMATDSSAAALAVARRNADRHGVAARIRFAEGDLLQPLEGSFDLIVSNPPYVPQRAELPPEVVRFEPHHALFAGPDGLTALSTLIGSAAAYLAAGGRFVIEFGFGQAEAVRELARAAGWRSVALHCDLQGIPRVAVMVPGP